MKKGFTLIELLAVIVILAIIALIATPIVLNIISDSKESATIRNIENYISAVEQSIVQENFNRNFDPYVCEIESNGKIKCDEEITDISIDINGKKPTSGTLMLDKGKVLEGSIISIDSKKYMYRDSTYTEIIETDKDCFVYGDVYDFDYTGYYSINHDACMTYFKNSDQQYFCDYDINNFIKIAYSAFNKKPNDFISEGVITKIQDMPISTIITDYICDSKDVVIPEGVTAIGASAFSNKKIKSLVLAETLTTIPSFAFIGNELTSIIIPGGISRIETTTFGGNKLKNIALSKGITSINSFSFNDSNNLTRILIPSTVEEIVGPVFGNDITSVKIVNTPENIYIPYSLTFKFQSGSNCANWDGDVKDNPCIIWSKK